MKTRKRKQEDLVALTEQFQNSKAALMLSFSGLTVDKDQRFRNELRETGATYQVVKNTLARIAVKDTPFEEATGYFKGVTSVAWTNGEAVELSKVVTKYLKEYKDILELKGGVVDGKLVDAEGVNAIATLPSKEELISKLLFLLNAPAQRLATVLSAVPRDLAIVLKQISESEGNPEPETKVDQEESISTETAPAVEEVSVTETTEETPVEETTENVTEEPAEGTDDAPKADETE